MKAPPHDEQIKVRPVLVSYFPHCDTAEVEVQQRHEAAGPITRASSRAARSNRASGPSCDAEGGRGVSKSR